jgi:5-methylthioadenosine/S-adenosylhomocysteine deaminase
LCCRLQVEPTSSLLRGGLIDHGDGRFEVGDLRVADGRIAEVSRRIESWPGEQVLDCRGRMVIPGLVNAHTHSNETWHRGRYERLPMEPWLAYAYPADLPAQDPPDIYVRTLLAAMEALRCGTTSVIDVLFEPGGFTEASLDAVVRAYRAVGIRATVALGMADRPDPSRAPDPSTPPLDSLYWANLARWAVERFHRPEEGISIALGPASPHRCTDRLLESCRSLSDEFLLGIHTHLLETRSRVVTGRRLYRRDIVEHLATIGFLGPRCCLAHAVWVSLDQMKTIAESDSIVVHNPFSNLKLGSGLCPLPALRTRGVTLALGTDGTSTNDGADLLATAKLAALLHTLWLLDAEEWPTAAEIWRMATIGGARAVGDYTLGRLEAGARADLVLLDLGHPSFTPLNEPLLHLVFSAPAQAVDTVLVGGRTIMKGRKVLGADEGAVLAEARARAPAVLARAARAETRGRDLIPEVIDGWRASLASDVGVNRSLRMEPG